MAQPLDYHKAAPPSAKYGLEFLQEIKDQFNWIDEEKVLDIGCGPGNFTMEILQSFLPQDASLIGSDKSKDMIDYANSNFNGSGIIFKVMDIESNELWDSWKKESFTRIFSFMLFHWLQNFRVALENMYSLLKPGGEIYLVYLADHKCFNAFIEIRNSEKWKDFIKERVYFEWSTNTTVDDRKKRIFEDLKHAGFVDIEINVREGTNWYTSAEHFIRTMYSLDEYKRYIPQKLQTEYSSNFENIMRNLLSKCPESGQLFIKIKWFSIRAKKF